jgi:hypothetical protein
LVANQKFQIAKSPRLTYADGMTQEVRNNLIFLAIFLAISLPGAVILFKKKLDPNAAPMYLPAPAYTDRLFNDPSPAPPDAARVVPPLTQQWLAELRGPSPQSATAVPLFEPAMDPTHNAQLLALWRDAGTVNATLILWDIPVPGSDDAIKVNLVTSSGVVDAHARTASRVELPIPIRRELQDRGFVSPPVAVTVVKVEFDLEDSLSELEKLLVSGKETRLISIETISDPVHSSR